MTVEGPGFELGTPGLKLYGGCYGHIQLRINLVLLAYQWILEENMNINGK